MYTIIWVKDSAGESSTYRCLYRPPSEFIGYHRIESVFFQNSVKIDQNAKKFN